MAEGKQDWKISKKKAYPLKRVPVKKDPEFIKPMLAKEVPEPFDDDDFIFEIKWDGYRAIAAVTDGDVQLYSRNGNDFLATYPLIAEALTEIDHNCMMDGEIVVLDEAGKSNFQMLQHYSENKHRMLCFMVFDLLSLDDYDLYELPLTDRKELLQKLIPGKDGIIRYSDHVNKKGINFFKAAIQNDLEGIMAKKAASLYKPGVRTNDWLKIKHHKNVDAVVVGYTQPTGSRPYFGALVLATQTPDGLKYAGHTGTGFNNRSLKEVFNQLQPYITSSSPFKTRVKTNTPVTWVKPAFIAEIKHTEETKEGNFRHPVFLRMKPLEKETIIVEEEPVPHQPIKNKTVATKADEKNDSLTLNGKKVKITNRQKIYFPEDGITKGDVIDYYQSMAKYILPHLKDRPQSLNRYPNGIHQSSFYHKDAGDEAPVWMKKHTVFSESTKKDIDYVICNNEASMAYLNNMGCIEFNPWNSTIKKEEYPDYLIMDLDPSDKNSFEHVIEATLATKEVLDRAGAAAFCKTSGSTGIHVYVPMGKKYHYDQVRDFAKLIATLVQEMLPSTTTLERSLQKRSNKKIYLDYLQNRRGQTLASVYSLRPKVGATVSTPLDWKEVKSGLSPKDYNIHNIKARVEKLGDIFLDVMGKGIDMKKCIEKLYG